MTSIQPCESRQLYPHLDPVTRDQLNFEKKRLVFGHVTEKRWSPGNLQVGEIVHVTRTACHVTHHVTPALASHFAQTCQRWSRISLHAGRGQPPWSQFTQSAPLLQRRVSYCMSCLGVVLADLLSVIYVFAEFAVEWMVVSETLYFVVEFLGILLLRYQFVDSPTFGCFSTLLLLCLCLWTLSL